MGNNKKKKKVGKRPKIVVVYDEDKRAYVSPHHCLLPARTPSSIAVWEALLFGRSLLSPHSLAPAATIHISPCILYPEHPNSPSHFAYPSEYLTGFHKRKLQRQQKAKDEIAERANAARLEDRREMREARVEARDELCRVLGSHAVELPVDFMNDGKGDSEDDEKPYDAEDTKKEPSARMLARGDKTEQYVERGGRRGRQE